MIKGRNIVLRLLQLIPAAILFTTAYGKLTSQALEVHIFSQLGMEPTGRYIIGVIEGLAALLFLTKRLAATGALLAVGTMLGALIAHITILGFDLQHTVMLSTVLFISLIVLISRRGNLPFIGKVTFEEGP